MGLFNAFLPKTIAALSTILIIGDKLLSFVVKVKPSVNDLFFGNVVNLVVSFTSDATILGEVNSLSSFNATLSNPWSINGISDPPELVPDTVLIDAVTDELSPHQV